MAAVAWPDVRAYLAGATVASVLTGVKVYDGPVVTGDTPDLYFTVAHQPSNPDAASGSFEHAVGPDGFAVAEAGLVACELAGKTGLADVPDVFGTFALLAAHLQDNQTLGGALSRNATVTAAAEVVEEQTSRGGVQRLLVTVNYTTLVP